MSHHQPLRDYNLKIIMIGVLLGVITFFIGYQSGWEDRQASTRSLVVIEPSKVQAITPLQSRDRPPLPQGHPTIPQTDQHGHPTFDCSALKSALPKQRGELTIASLMKGDHPRAGDAGEVEVSAVIVGAYFGILGTNWYHLCDEPNGQALVISSDQLTPTQSLVRARGSLLFDYNLSDIYRFPIYIKGATLSGDQVRAPQPRAPEGVMKL